MRRVTTWYSFWIVILEGILFASIYIWRIDIPCYFETVYKIPCPLCYMTQAMDYLLENGHRKICVIEGGPNLDSTRLRHKGWRAAVRKHGLDPDEIPIVGGTYRYASGYQGAKLLLQHKPTAILCFNDEMAFGARTAIDEAGLSVPGDVSLIGIDNWDLSGYSDMHLTTVERNMGVIAREGARVLLRRLDGGIVDNRRIYLDNMLFIRDTVRNLKEE